MRVVIVGAGEVGYHVIGSLYREGVDIQVVDTDPGVLEQLKSEFNVATLLGNATNSKLLEEAGVDRADLFIAITNYDETNIISCMLAGNLSRAKKIARVKSMDIGRSFSEAIHFGIDLIINPYEVSAEFLEKLIDYPIVTDINQFLDEKVLLVRIPIEEGNPLVDCSVMDFGQKSRLTNTLIALVQREGESFMPRAETMIRLDD
ncbi:MAG: NAD-binding protein, partial [Deltaproteobacteria bacterium]|nr:NAD-binding protein [Deltaproteobacteria bacterium]